MKKPFQKYPRYTSDNQPFQYYISQNAMDMTHVTRGEFLEVIRSVPQSDDHVYLDHEGGVAIFFMDSNAVNEILDFSRRDFNREAKRQERAHQCVMKGTKQCDGWKPDENGLAACDTCTRRHTARTISIDTPVNSEDGDDPIFMDFPSDEDAFARLFEEADKAILQDALDTLPAADREYLLARFQPGMTARKLAEQYNIRDYRYANRKARRILEQVVKHIQKFEK